MQNETRCIDGRLFRHDPQRDDPDLETDIGTCPECEGRGCDAESSLRDRCKAFYQTMQTNAMLRQSSPVDDLMAFVMAETGRSAGGESLKDTLPLVLYFGGESDRDEFLAIVREAKPGMVAKKMP